MGSWTASVMPVGVGVFPQLALDPGTGLLVLAYGSLSYPRNSVAVVWSSDAGVTWSNEVVLHEEFTTGYTSLQAMGGGRFLLLADRTPTQVGCGGAGACDPRCDSIGAAFSIGAVQLQF